MSPDEERGDPEHPAGSWAGGAFVDRWIAEDALIDVLDLPRRLTAALVRESGIEVRRIVDVGVGTGAYLRILLDEFPDAEGVWIDASDAMLERAEASLADLTPRVTFRWAISGRPTVFRSGGRGGLGAGRASLPARDDPAVLSRRARRAGPRRVPVTSITSRLPATGEARYEAIRPRFVPGAGGGGGGSHHHDAPPQPLDGHLAWLRAAGFDEPDVPWRLFWTALVVARTPS